MLMSNLFGERLRSKPSDASLVSHVFLLRGGYIRPVGSGIYSMLTPCIKIQRKIENIIREEMNKIGGQEILLPFVVPAELWKQSGRFDSVGSELLRFKDRTNRDMVLSMTHEEAAVNLAKTEARSYLNYPFMIYQIQTKFRDEPRARGGLIRVREFTMKDAYSFHTTQEDLEEYYVKVHKAYERIFERVGLSNVISIYSDTGMMGGSGAHEFMLVSDAGEDSIVLCDECGYKANMEVATSKLRKNDTPPVESLRVDTKGITTIDELSQFFNVDKARLIKAVVYSCDNMKKPTIVFIRGDLKVNESKLRNYLKAEVKELSDIEGYDFEKGYIGPSNDILDKYNVIFDMSLKGESNMICGANQKDYHIVGFNISRDIGNVSYIDVAKVEEGQECPICKGKLKVKRGIEIGNIFKLGNKYTKSMDMQYTDKDGLLKTPIMGCYGIGVGRLIAGVVENSHDDFGPIWPKNIAPWQIHICALNLNKDEVKEKSFSLYKELSSKYDVLFDDRNLSAGAQFADADLLGIPVRVIISKRNLDNEQFEVVIRNGKESKQMSYENMISFLENFYQ